MKLLPTLLCSVLLTGSTLAEQNHTKGAEPLRIAHGEMVNLTDYLVPGKTTVFDFTSEYCGPCRAYEQPLHLLHQKRADIAVVKVDINRPGLTKIDWQSPVARQYGMSSIPHFKVFGPDGQLIAEDQPHPGGHPARHLVDGWIAALN